MRIAIVTTSYPAHEGDASGHFIEHEARDLERAGHDVTVIKPAPGGAFGWPGALARIRERPLRVLDAARFVQGARRSLASFEPDRVIAHWLVPSGFPIALAARKSELEVVVHGSDLRLLERLPRPLTQTIIARLVSRDARFRCVSHDLRERLRALAPVTAARVAPCAIDVSFAPTRTTARADLELADDALVVLVVGRLVASKRTDVALVAASLLGADVVVIGDGPERARLERGFPAACFLGQQDRAQTLAWIAAADLLLSASRDEGSPTAIREARALGTPVVCTRCGDLADWAIRDPELHVIG